MLHIRKTETVRTIKFQESIKINRNLLDIFDYTQDYDKRLEWDTFLKKAELINGATEAGLGVKSFCQAYNGLGIETEYVSFNRPKVAAIKMTKGPFMFKSFLGSWNFKQINSRNTNVVFLYSYELRFPFSLLLFLIKPILQRNVKQRLIDLKLNMENLPVQTN